MKPLIFSVGVFVGVIAALVWRRPCSTEPQKLSPSETAVMAGDAQAPRSAATVSASEDVAGAIRRIQVGLNGVKRAARGKRMAKVVEGIDARQFPGILSGLASSNLTPADRRELTSAILDRWAEVAPREASEYFGTLPAADQAANIDAFAATLAAQDPESALGWARKLENPQVRGLAIGQALASMAENDPKTAIGLLNELDPTMIRIAGARVYQSWAELDPNAARAAAMSGGGGRNWALRAVGAVWGKTDPAGALEWIKSNSLDSSSAIFAMAVAGSAGKVDPKAAMDAMMLSPSGSHYSNLARGAALSEWMSLQPDAAREWLRSLPDDQKSVLLLTAGRSGGPNPEAWFAALSELPPSPDRAASLESLIQQWSSSEPEKALMHFAAVKDPKLLQQVMPIALKGVVNSDPELALRTAMGLRDEARNSTLSYIAAAWTANNPAEARAQIMQMPEDNTKQLMIMSSAGAQAQIDPQGAIKWAGTLPDVSSRDNALSAIAGVAGRKSPELALQAAQSIQQSVLREKVLANISKATPKK